MVTSAAPSLAISLLNSNDSNVDQIQQQVKALEKCNKMLCLKVSSVMTVGAADKFQVLQIWKMVKEDLFKKGKFINKPKLEMLCMKYLANKFSIKPEDKCDWMVTYALYTKDALNNKCNNVSQDLKKLITGKHLTWPHLAQAPHWLSNTNICLLVLAVNPAYSHKCGEDFINNVRLQVSIIQEHFNVFLITWSYALQAANSLQTATRLPPPSWMVVRSMLQMKLLPRLWSSTTGTSGSTKDMPNGLMPVVVTPSTKDGL